MITTQTTVRAAIIAQPDGSWSWLTAEFVVFANGTLVRADAGESKALWGALAAIQALYPHMPAFGGPHWDMTSQGGVYECQFTGTF